MRCAAVLFATLAGCAASVAPRAPSDAAVPDASVSDAPAPAPDATSLCPADLAGAVGAPCDAPGRTCGGPCTDACAACDRIQCAEGRWRADAPTTIGCDASTPDASPPVTERAILSWQSARDATNQGPALIVRDDGTVRVWDNAPPFDPEGTPATEPDRTFALGLDAVNDLWRRWYYVHRGPPVPQGPDAKDCTATLHIRPCSTCDTTDVHYHVERALEPTIDLLLIWFETNLPTDLAGAQPGTYCVFH